MKIISVAGSGSGCGKTTVVCGFLRAIPGLGAIKISPREHPLQVEWGAGETGKDTDLFVRNGAIRVARIVGPRDDVGQAWELIQGEFRQLRGVVVEGTRGIYLPGEKLRIFVGGDNWQAQLDGQMRKIVADSAMIIELSPHCSPDIIGKNGFLAHKVKYSHNAGCFVHKSERLEIDPFEVVRTFLS